MCIEDQNLTKYNSNRPEEKRSLLCYAPFTNMYFNVLGDVAPCWLGFSNPDSIKNKSISEIWFGDKFETFRQNIINLKLKNTCNTCKKNIISENYHSVLSRAYDITASPKTYPVMMELELDNTCNFDCVMCNEYLSSTIERRINRQQKSKSIYDDNFVGQLEEFIPHLHEIRFNGGEPFLIEIYYEIWERIIKINPKLKIVVATNGSVYNSRIEKILSKGNFHINISIDSLKEKRYSEIRKNGNLEITLKNFHKFLNYTKKKSNTICVLTNPMRINWEEMPDFVKFCNRFNIPLWFNTITHPKDLSLWALPQKELSVIYNKLSKSNFIPNIFKPQSIHNIKTYRNLVNVQIYNWMLESNNQGTEVLKFDSFESIKNYMQKIQCDNELIQKICTIEDVLIERGIDSNLIIELMNQYSIEELIEYLKNQNQNDIFDTINKFLRK